MLRKITGITLLVIGGFFGIVLIAGGLVWPHIIGPSILATIGVILLALKGKAK